MDTKLDILQMLNDGIISVDEASKLLEAVSDATPTGATPDEGVTLTSESIEPPAMPADMGRFRRLSYIPFALSFAMLMLTGGGAYATFLRTEGRLTFGFVLLLALFILALLITTLALWATTVPWLHVRIRSTPKEGSSGTRFAISLPLPLTLAGWAMRLAHRFVDVDTAGRLDAAAALLHTMRHDLGKPGAEPVVVDVNDDDERVQVYIG
jgi:hypothetical protein